MVKEIVHALDYSDVAADARRARQAGSAAEVQAIGAARLRQAGLIDHPDIGPWLLPDHRAGAPPRRRARRVPDRAARQPKPAISATPTTVATAPHTRGRPGRLAQPQHPQPEREEHARLAHRDHVADGRGLERASTSA